MRRCHFHIGILVQVWYLIVSIPDICPLSYFLSSSVSIYDFSTLLTILPHNLIKEKLTELTKHTFTEGSFYLARNETRSFNFF